MKWNQRIVAALALVVAVGLAAGCSGILPSEGWLSRWMTPKSQLEGEFAAAKHLFRSERYEQAEVAFQRIVNTYGREEENLTSLSRYFLARSVMVQGQFKRAAQKYEKFLKDTPHQNLVSFARFDLAVCLERSGETEKAKKIYEDLATTGAASQLEHERQLGEKAKARAAALSTKPK